MRRKDAECLPKPLKSGVGPVPGGRNQPAGRRSSEKGPPSLEEKRPIPIAAF
jgi:hypothetical protein